QEWGSAAPGTQAGPREGALGALLILSGQMEVTVRDGQGVSRHRHQPGTLVLLSGDAPREVVRTEGTAQGLAIALTDGWCPEHRGKPARDWRDVTTSLVPDPTALSLGQAMRSELERGAPSGPLYAEALSLSLLALTEARASSHAVAPKLTLPECGRIRDHVEQHLETPISIDALAALVGLRRRQFASRFRATFGMSAYNYVLQRRVARGATLLARGRSIAEVAMTVGFSSQSHFTMTYRRQLGVTPSAGRPRARTRPLPDRDRRLPAGR
ncbi:MAG: AraC family transcriptional regulator, partial [Myxococcales bacterium]|nr:AraC family transcriptional regulator [Myxococcales bacterium]